MKVGNNLDLEMVINRHKTKKSNNRNSQLHHFAQQYILERVAWVTCL